MNALRHDVAQPGVPRIVHRDHRAEVLGELGSLVADRDALRRTEHLGMPAGVEHVVVAGQRPVPGAPRRRPRPPTAGETRSAPRGAAWRTRRRGCRRRRPQKSHEPRLISDSGTSGGGVPFTRVAIPTRTEGRPVSRRADAEVTEIRCRSVRLCVCSRGTVIAPSGAQPTCRTTVYDVGRRDRRGVARRQHPDVDAVAGAHVGRCRADPR